MSNIGSSDLAISRQLTTNSHDLSKKMNHLNTQLSTGQKAQLYSDFAPDEARIYTGNCDLKSENDQLIKDLTTCGQRLESTEVKIRSISQKFDQFRIQLTQVIGPDAAKNTDFNGFCRQMLLDIQADLNGTDFEKDNLFGGNKTSGAVCDVTELPIFTLGEAPSYAYALGDATLQQVGDSLTYGVTALDPAIALVLQCVKIGADNIPNDDIKSTSMMLLSQSMGDAAQASDSMSQTLATVKIQQAQITNQVNDLDASSKFLTENLAKTMGVNPVKLRVESVNVETQMSISFQVLQQMMKAAKELLDILR